MGTPAEVDIPLSQILAPLDGTPEATIAVPYALALAGPGGAIELLTVVRDAADSAAAEAALATQAEALRGKGATVNTRVLVGDPAGHIIEAAANGGAAMIAMASRGRGAINRLIHGDVADVVSREATVPVLVVRTGEAVPEPVKIDRLVLPLDGSDLAAESIPVATALAKRLGTPLALLRAVNVADILPPVVGMGEAIPFQVYDEAEHDMRAEAARYLDETAATLRAEGFTVETKVLTGPPASAIAEATNTGDVVVLCSNERSGALRWLLGSVAEQLVRTDEAPVLLVPAPEEASA